MVVYTSLSRNLLGASIFRDGLGALRHGVLGQFSGQEQTDCGLDFPGSDGGASVVVSQTGSFSGDALEDVVDKAVHDGHSLAGHTSIRVDLSQHLVDVDRVRFPPLPPALLVRRTDGLCLRGGLLRSFACNSFSWHDYSVNDGDTRYFFLLYKSDRIDLLTILN